MKMIVFWDVVPCSLVEVNRRYTGTYCLHHEGDHDDEGSISETSVNFYQTTRPNIPEDSHLHGYVHFVLLYSASFSTFYIL
jgi:hypothetical protein